MRFPVLFQRLAALCLAVVATAALATAGEVVDVAGTGKLGYSGDGGLATKAQFNNPFGITRGPDGALYVVEFEGNVVRRIATDGTISTFAGSGRKGGAGDGGPALEAEFNQPHEIRFDREGNLYLSDMLNHRIRRVDAKTHRVSTVAGTGKAGFAGDGGPATSAALNNPIAIQFDAAGDLYVCDIGNHRIRQIQMKSGVIRTFAGTGAKAATPDGGAYATAPLNGPRTLDFDADGNLWVALREGNQVWRLDVATGRAHHVAGTGKQGFTGNGGPAAAATLSGPKGIAVAPNGDVYVADTESHAIRAIHTKSGVIDAVVGNGVKGDGPVGPGESCRLARPHGVYVDRDGTVYIGDSENHRVRAVRPGR